MELFTVENGWTQQELEKMTLFKNMGGCHGASYGSKHVKSGFLMDCVGFWINNHDTV